MLFTHPFIDVVDLGAMSGEEKSSRLTTSQSCPLHETVPCRCTKHTKRMIQKFSVLQEKQTHTYTHTVNKGHERAPVAVSGASALLPLWISWAAKLFSSNEVPFMTGASSSNGFTEASEDTVIYCKASQRAVLPSWSLSSRSSLTWRTDNTQD